MPGDDIRDLLGRYAVGSLTTEERERLFDAALSDQDLFEELAREQELKMLLDEPGARDRMMRALEAPNRRATWILAPAIAAALSIVLIAFLMRPVHKPTQVAVATTSPSAVAIPPPESAPPEVAKSEPQPVRVARAVKAKAATGAPEPPPAQPNVDQPGVNQRSVDQPAKDQKEVDQVAATAPPPPAPQKRVAAARAMTPQLQQAQQFAPGGPKQSTQQVEVRASSSALAMATEAFGFHYSIETKGHLIIVPGADGYLFVKSDSGAILFARKQIAAAITTDVVLPGAANSVTITFSASESPVETTPVARTEPNGTVEGAANLAIQLKRNP
jgi:hypothetical protein